VVAGGAGELLTDGTVQRLGHIRKRRVHRQRGAKNLHYQTSVAGIRDIAATVVWHASWRILHPLVEEGRAVKLWPDPSPVDPAMLPEVHPDEFRFLLTGDSVHFTDDEHLRRVAQTPLQVGVDVTEHFLNS
jgi:hypothetical protein